MKELEEFHRELREHAGVKRFSLADAARAGRGILDLSRVLSP